MDNQKRPAVICLTPVKNEAWILDKFLKSASLWADYIIISDQGSTDGSLEIAKKYPKVILLENEELPYFDEYLMRKPLFDAARKIKGDRILLSIDADELLTPCWHSSPEWDTILSAPKGTIIALPLFNISTNFDSYWNPNFIQCGYIDDETEYHTNALVHVSRSIVPSSHDCIYLREIAILHFQFTDWERMACKQRWYQCFELIKKVNDPVGIFRRYHHMYKIDSKQLKPIPTQWIEEYTKFGVDITSVYHQALLPWEKTILQYMDQFGVSFFRHLDIWTADWCYIAEKWNHSNPKKYKDPRNILEKFINRILIKTQGHSSCSWIDPIIRIFY